MPLKESGGVVARRQSALSKMSLSGLQSEGSGMTDSRSFYCVRGKNGALPVVSLLD